jgi:NADH dehydrogenase
MKQIVIIGGGFAGIRTARQLKKQKDVFVTIVNDGIDFRYCPALYRAATGSKLGTARLPLEWMLLDNSNTDLIINRAVSINAEKKQVILEDKTTLEYDYLVCALGSETTYFNIEGVHENSYGIKSADEVIKFRKHLHDKIKSNATADENYVVVGAGPTGVELAAALGSYLNRIAKSHKAKNHKIKIWLVEAGPRVLPQMSERASRIVHKHLEKKGVRILVDTKVEAESVQMLKTSGINIKSHSVIWTAGYVNNKFYKENSNIFDFAKNGKVKVDKHLTVFNSIYVAGDNAATQFSGTALTAIRHGNFVAEDIIARINRTKRPTKYESKPVVVIPAGKNWAIMQYGKFVFHGRIVSMIRSFADYVGYSDVLGMGRALTIWSNSDNTDDRCPVCKTRKVDSK